MAVSCTSSFPNTCSRSSQGHATGPQQHRLLPGQVEDGRFHADVGGAAVQNHIYSSIQVGQHMLCQGRAGTAGKVGARRRDRHSAPVNQRQGYQVRRHAQSDAGQSGGDNIRHHRGAGRIRVSGPGQNLAVNRSAITGQSLTSRRACSVEATCRISGLRRGRPLAMKIPSTAAGSRPFAPSPYTVSVGKATVPPLLTTAAASVIASGSGFPGLTLR